MHDFPTGLSGLLALAQQVPAADHPGGPAGTIGVVAELLKAGGIYTVAAILLWVCWRLYQDNQKLHQEKESIMERLTAQQVAEAARVSSERQAEVREITNAVRTLAEYAQNVRSNKR